MKIASNKIELSVAAIREITVFESASSWGFSGYSFGVACSLHSERRAPASPRLSE
jgi:hypothetical protein